MRVKTLTLMRHLLFAAACICCFVGVVLSQVAAAESARDVTKIDIQITGRDSCYNPKESPYINGCYHVDMTYRITNHTKVEWKYLKITTTVSDRSGTVLGTIRGEFGTPYGNSALHVKPEESVDLMLPLDQNPNSMTDFFAILYEWDLSDLVFESEVTSGTYVK